MDVRGALERGQPGVDIPIGYDVAEMVERHLDELVDAGLVRAPLLAPVIDAEDFASKRQWVRERVLWLGIRSRRHDQDTDKEQECRDAGRTDQGHERGRALERTLAPNDDSCP